MYDTRAISAGAGSPAGQLFDAHPVARLVRAHLTGSPTIRLVPAIPPVDYHEAVARYGSGVDHAAGEVPLAMVKDRFNSQQAARGYHGQYLVTDRRIFGSTHVPSVPHGFTEVPYAHIDAPPGKVSGVAAQSTLVSVARQPRKLYVAPKQLQSYLAALVLSVPPPARTFGPRQPPPPSVHDPIGASGAAQAVGGPDPRTWVPLRALFEAHRRGVLDAAAGSALVTPMILAARGLSFGRGSCVQGSPPGSPVSSWHSVLPRPVLGLALRAVLGEPAAAYPGPAGEALDFAIGAGSGAGRAAASTAVGIAMFATLGVGWISTSHGHKLATLRAQTTDAPVGSAYQLFGTSGAQFLPLSLHWWRTVDAISQALFRLESRYLLGLVLYGADRSPTDLLSVPRETLQASVAALIGPTDLTAFYPS